jgi:hypothetical protein
VTHTDNLAHGTSVVFTFASEDFSTTRMNVARILISVQFTMAMRMKPLSKSDKAESWTSGSLLVAFVESMII